MPAAAVSVPVYVTRTPSPLRSNEKSGAALPSARTALHSTADIPAFDEQLALLRPLDADRPRLARQEVDHVVLEHGPTRRVVRPRVLEHDPDRGDTARVP